MQNGTFIRIFIASPGDVYQEREEACRVIQSWNAAHSLSRSVLVECRFLGKQSFQSMRSQAGAWERVEKVANTRQVLVACWLTSQKDEWRSDFCKYPGAGSNCRPIL